MVLYYPLHSAILHEVHGTIVHSAWYSSIHHTVLFSSQCVVLPSISCMVRYYPSRSAILHTVRGTIIQTVHGTILVILCTGQFSTLCYSAIPPQKHGTGKASVLHTVYGTVPSSTKLHRTLLYTVHDTILSSAQCIVVPWWLLPWDISLILLLSIVARCTVFLK
jgi:hypothetical protein